MISDKEFDKLIKSGPIDCLICNLTIGNGEAVIKHMKKRHAELYKKYAMEVDPELYRQEMIQDNE